MFEAKIGKLTYTLFEITLLKTICLILLIDVSVKIYLTILIHVCVNSQKTVKVRYGKFNERIEIHKYFN